MKTKGRRFMTRLDVGGALSTIALVLGLAMPLVGPRRTRAQVAPQASASAKAPGGDAEKGRRLFVKYGCYQCHGTEAQGGGYTGPRLAPPAPPLAVLLSQLRDPAKDMPPYTKNVLSDQELFDIYAFLQSVPHPPAINTIPILRSSK